MKVILCTAHGPEYQALADITRPTLESYQEKHGYTLVYDNERTDKDACKVDIFRQLFATGRLTSDDVFVWFDTDAAVLNREIKIEHIVYGHMPRSTHFLIGCDPNGINSGVFIARFSHEANVFMTVATTHGTGSGWADQEGYIQKAVQEPHASIFKQIPGKVFNCNDYRLKGWDFGEYGKYINEYEPGDFCIHLAGVEEPTRTDALRGYVARAK